MGGIDLKNISYGVNGKPILQDITLHLTEARIGILGRNGSGKTSLLRLMAGLVKADRGQITVSGHSPDDRRAMLRRIGILFQNPDRQIIFPTVIEELAFGLRQMGATKDAAEARVLALLQAHQRGHWASANIQDLSHGQKQWLCLMAIVLMGPDILLLDEPFAALDIPAKLRLTRLLSGLPQRLIMISHDSEAVRHYDRLIWLESGRVVMDGPPEKLLPAFQAEMEKIGGLDADTYLSH